MTSIYSIYLPKLKFVSGENDFSQKTLDVGYFEGLQETHFHYDIQVLGHQLMKFIELKENYAEKQNIFKKIILHFTLSFHEHFK